MNNIQLQKVLGTGIIFPIQLDSTGKVPLTTGAELIRSSIKIVLSWIFGTKLMQGNFGSLLLLYLEDPNDDILAHQVDYSVESALELWETRIQFLASSIKRQENGIQLSLTYQIIGTDIKDSFTYPFYQTVLS